MRRPFPGPGGVRVSGALANVAPPARPSETAYVRAAQARERCERDRARLTKKKAKRLGVEKAVRGLEKDLAALPRARTTRTKAAKARLRKQIALGQRRAEALAEEQAALAQVSRVSCGRATRLENEAKELKAEETRLWRRERARAARERKRRIVDDAERAKLREEGHARRPVPPSPRARYEAFEEELVAIFVEEWMFAGLKAGADAVKGHSEVMTAPDNVVRGQIAFEISPDERREDVLERLKEALEPMRAGLHYPDVYWQGIVTHRYPTEPSSPGDRSRAIGAGGKRAHEFRSYIVLGDHRMAVEAMLDMAERSEDVNGPAIETTYQLTAQWTPTGERPER